MNIYGIAENNLRNKIVFVEKNLKDEEYTNGYIFNESKKYLGYMQERGVKRGNEIILLLKDNKDFLSSF